MTVTQTKITTKHKPINLPDKGKVADIEEFRFSIRDKYKELIKQHTTGDLLSFDYLPIVNEVVCGNIYDNKELLK